MIIVPTELSFLCAYSAHLFLGCTFEYLICTCYLKTIPPMKLFNLLHIFKQLPIQRQKVSRIHSSISFKFLNKFSFIRNQKT